MNTSADCVVKEKEETKIFLGNCLLSKCLEEVKKEENLEKRLNLVSKMNKDFHMVSTGTLPAKTCECKAPIAYCPSSYPPSPCPLYEEEKSKEEEKPKETKPETETETETEKENIDNTNCYYKRIRRGRLEKVENN